MTFKSRALGRTIAAAAVALVPLTACSAASSHNASSPDSVATPVPATVTHTTVAIPASTTALPKPSTVTTTVHATATRHVTATPTPRTSAPIGGSTSTPTTTSTADDSNTNNGASKCLSSHLILSSEGGGGAGGTDYRLYSLRNTGSNSCTMRGYAGVSIVDSDGKTVQHPAQRGRTGTEKAAPVKTISLKPHGGKAYFLVTSINVIPSSPDCQHAFHGNRLRVYPPNNTTPLYLADTRDFCDLGVGAVTATKKR